MKEQFNLRQIEQFAEDARSVPEIAQRMGKTRAQLVYLIERRDDVRDAICRGQAKNTDIRENHKIKPRAGFVPEKSAAQAVKPEAREVLKQKVLRLIEQRYCTFSRIQLMLGLPDARDTADILNDLALDGEVVKLEQGSLAAYFLPDKIPARFWLAGDGSGRVAMEMPKEKIVRRKIDDALAADAARHRTFTINLPKENKN